MGSNDILILSHSIHEEEILSHRTFWCSFIHITRVTPIYLKEECSGIFHICIYGAWKSAEQLVLCPITNYSGFLLENIEGHFQENKDGVYNTANFDLYIIRYRLKFYFKCIVPDIIRK